MGVMTRDALRWLRFGVGGQEAVFLYIVATTTEVDLRIVGDSGVRIVTHGTIFANRHPVGIVQLKSLLNIGVTAKTERPLFLDQVLALLLEMGLVTDQTVIVFQNRVILAFRHLLAKILVASEAKRGDFVRKQWRNGRFVAFMTSFARFQSVARMHFVRRIILQNRIVAAQTDVTGWHLHNPGEE